MPHGQWPMAIGHADSIDHRTTMPTENATLSRVYDRLRHESTAEVRFDRGYSAALRHRRQPLPDRAARRGRAPDGRRCGRRRADRRRGGGAGAAPRGAATSLSGQTVGPAIVLDFSKYLNRIGIVDRDRDDRPGRAGRGARPAERPPPAARADVRPGRLDERPGHARRDDRQQLGRGPVAAVRQDGRSRPSRSRSSWPTAPRPRFGPLGDAELAEPAGATGPRRPRSTGRSARPWTGASGRRSHARFPKILRRVSGYNLDEFVPGLPVRARGLAGGALGIQPGPADRRLGGDAGGRHRGRAEGRAEAARAGAGGPLVRDDPGGAGPARARSSRPARWPSRCSTGRSSTSRPATPRWPGI